MPSLDAHSNRKKRLSRIILIASLAFLAACGTTPLQVKKMQQMSLKEQPKVIALLSVSAYDADIRLALAEHGFKTLKFASIKRIEHDATSTRREAYAEAEARFGLTFYPGGIVDYCIGGTGSVKFGRAAFELSDLATNEAVMYLHAGGWTAPCGFHDDLVWTTLAKALANNWQ